MVSEALGRPVGYTYEMALAQSGARPFPLVLRTAGVHVRARPALTWGPNAARLEVGVVSGAGPVCAAGDHPRGDGEAET